MKIHLLTDTGSDFEKEYLNDEGIDQVEISVYFKEEKFNQRKQDHKNRFYQKLVNSNTFPTTSQASPNDFLEYFQEVKDKNEAIIAILISSELSGTYQAANLAKQMIDYEQIYIIDSKTASIGQMILVEYANRAIKEGCSLQEIISKLKKIRENIVLTAIVDNLEYLYRGGRLSKAEKFVSNLLNIKPILELKSPGVIGLAGKAMNLNGAINKMIKEIELDEFDKEFGMYLFYTYEFEGLRKIEQKLKIKEHKLVQMGPTIGAHVGPEAYGVAYVKKNKQ